MSNEELVQDELGNFNVMINPEPMRGLVLAYHLRLRAI